MARKMQMVVDMDNLPPWEQGGKAGRYEALAMLDALYKVAHTCPADKRFRCGGTAATPQRYCIRCWMQYLYWIVQRRHPAMIPRGD